jgi:serine/threonine protein kinase
MSRQFQCYFLSCQIKQCIITNSVQFFTRVRTRLLVQHEISIFISLKRHLRSPQGVLEDGQQIAVKKLSMRSRQGVREFLNEVRLLLKVQHRNLVSLLGCCASSGHKMLVYPYFPNGSLDHILFGESPPVRSQLVVILVNCYCRILKF